MAVKSITHKDICERFSSKSVMETACRKALLVLFCDPIESHVNQIKMYYARSYYVAGVDSLEELHVYLWRPQLSF